MDADWDELRVIPHVGPLPNVQPTHVSTLAFDNAQELLWIGSTYGRIQSFYGPQLERYTSYIGHQQPDAVRQILIHDRGVLSVSARSVHFALRTGPPIWHITNEKFKDLQCMSFTAKGNTELLVGGGQEQMFRIDVEKGQVTETLPAEAQYKIMKRGGTYICAATQNGAVHIIDSATMRVVKIWQAHLGIINDMDARPDFLVTCGLSRRQQHGLMPDPLANVFDLKSLSPLPPIPFQPGAAFVRMHPKMSTTSIVASQTGQLQVVDIMNPHTVNLKQAHIYENDYITALELAPTGEALALASSMCQVHLWGSPSRLKFAEYGHPIVFPDPIPQGPEMDWSDDTPLNTVGMPYYRETLLSAWPSMISEVGLLPPKINPELTTSMKRSEIGFYSTRPKTKHINQVDYLRIEDTQAAKNIAPPKFLSEKARDSTNIQIDDRGFNDALSELQVDSVANSKKDVPHVYRNVEIKYSKFGVDDFDFEFYNKTQYSGLETHIANSYANPLLQLYRFTPIIRNLALHHTASSCFSGDCMLCELGFLIDMLEKAAGQNCQASNFLKSFSGLSAAASLNLLEEHTANHALTMTIQSVNRFLLDKFTLDFRASSPQAQYNDLHGQVEPPSDLRSPYQAMATKVTATIRCAHCKHEQKRPEDPSTHSLMYPTKNMIRNQSRGFSRVTFSQAFKASIERQDQMRGWCPSCRRYQQLHTTRQVERMPAVFMINAAIHTAEAKQIWSTPNWLPSEIGIIQEQGQVFCYQDQDLKLHLQRGVYSIQVYELIGVVAEVSSVHKEKPHLVSLVNVASSSRDSEKQDDWHLFNDFLVQPVTKEDALRFDPSWKLPCVFTYQLKSVSRRIDNSWKDNLDTSLLFPSLSIAAQQAREAKLDSVTPLSHEERPKPGTHVGIDAEFVSLQSEEIEIKADGTRETVRPSRLGLARVSVLRGDKGPTADVPFIDDYISITEPIVDYLTAFSGIRPGDLNPNTSTHHLVSLKAAYKKLWLLLNLGVIFVGHGLLKDFRTINIHIPRGQVIDTVDMWFIRARQRKLNLRFLAWLLLDESIQGGDSHDSIEDARTALRLWRKYIDVQAAGHTEEKLEWIYKKGREYGFRAPGARPPGGGTAFSGSGTTLTNNRTSSEVTAAALLGTPGRATTPDLQPPGGNANYEDGNGGGSVAGTPARKLGFGAERVGFGSPLR